LVFVYEFFKTSYQFVTSALEQIDKKF